MGNVWGENPFPCEVRRRRLRLSREPDGRARDQRTGPVWDGTGSNLPHPLFEAVLRTLSAARRGGADTHRRSAAATRMTRPAHRRFPVTPRTRESPTTKGNSAGQGHFVAHTTNGILPFLLSAHPLGSGPPTTLRGDVASHRGLHLPSHPKDLFESWIPYMQLALLVHMDHISSPTSPSWTSSIPGELEQACPVRTIQQAPAPRPCH
jgi:hypothetical protein